MGSSSGTDEFFLFSFFPLHLTDSLIEIKTLLFLNVFEEILMREDDSVLGPICEKEQSSVHREV